MGAFLFIGSFYATALPIFEAADEISHYRVIKFIAAERTLPHIVDHAKVVGHESGQPPLYYALLAPFVGPINDDDFDQTVVMNPHFEHLNSRTVWHHLTPELERWDGTVLAVRVGRLLSLLFGAVTIWATWQLANLIMPANKRGFALLAAGFVALNPQFLAISASINNDNLVIALCSVVVLLTMRWHLSAEKAAVTPFWIGTVIGLATLSKISGLALGAMVGSALLLQLWQGRRFGLVIKDGLMLTAGLLTTAGWWLWRNHTLYGDPLGFGALRIAHAGTYRAEPLSPIQTVIESQLLLKTYWLFPGNGTLFGPDWFYWVVNIGLAVGLMGLIGLIGKWGSRPLENTKQWLILTPLITWLFVIIALLFYWISTVGATSQGRLMYPAISTLAVLLILGFFKLGEMGIWLARFFVVILGMAALLTPPFVIGGAYFPPETAAYTNYPNFEESVEIGPGLQLMGYELITPSLNLGDMPEVRLYWQATRPVEKSYYYILHFIDSAGVEVARYEGYPAGGNYPTLAWQINTPFAEQVTLSPITDNATAGIATMIVELSEWNRETKHEYTLQQKAKIRSRFTAERVEPDGTFGELADLDVTRTTIDIENNQLKIALNWHVIKPYPTNFTTFVHLLNQTGTLASQGDSQPQNGQFPTSFWKAGEIIPDSYTVPLDQVPSGNYTLMIGLYDPASGARLPVSNASSGGADHILIDITVP